MEATEDDLMTIHEVGPEVAKSVSSFFADKKTKALVAELRALGLEIAPAQRAEGGPPARGKDLRFHGNARGALARGGGAPRAVARRPRELEREQEDELRRRGRRGGLEAREGRELGVTILSEKEFKKLVDQKFA